VAALKYRSAMTRSAPPSCIIATLALLGRGPGVGGEPVEAVRHFWHRGAASIAGLSIVAILWAGLPVLLLAPCR
jgi:hypothetical protein